MYILYCQGKRTTPNTVREHFLKKKWKKVRIILTAHFLQKEKWLGELVQKVFILVECMMTILSRATSCSPTTVCSENELHDGSNSHPFSSTLQDRQCYLQLSPSRQQPQIIGILALTWRYLGKPSNQN